ncbi:MAG: 5-bromo-4-chloroindolyl phosphate hydrolysis family protein [Lachnospiraceae bacterium]|nr:5-bromo-4-chloroindolyl phosphate hydrolysis family protein [Lachnospiraceae bacterium]
MSGYQNRGSMGEQIKGALTEALQSGDFSKLNDLVSQTVNITIDEVRSNIASGIGTGLEKEKQAQEERERQEQERRNRLIQESRNKQELEQRNRQYRLQNKFRIKKIGNVSNVLYQVFGGIGLGLTGLFTLGYIFTALYDWHLTSVGGWIVNLLFLAFFSGMINVGIIQRRRLKRAERYVKLCDHKMYKNIKDLAMASGKKERYVVKDLQKMIDMGYFPEGHLDEQKTCFMLSDAIYWQYMDVEESRKRIEEENRITAKPQEESLTPKDNPAPEISDEQNSELNTMIAEGMECIRKLRELNDKIPGEVISAKLFRLESLLKEIFNSIREHPEQMHRMHKLMDYYLPTTLKLVEAYEEFDRVSAPGDEITAAKAEIENTLDTINHAFTELLNNLFQDSVFDATTDAQVLKTMLAREGLMNEMEFATIKDN